MLRSVNYKTQRVVNYKIVLIPILLAIAIQIQGCRAIWQKPDTIIENLKLDSTTIIADIGAGDGYFTFRFQKAIGSAGKVYAIEIDYQKYELLVREVEERGSSTVFPILINQFSGFIYCINQPTTIIEQVIYFQSNACSIICHTLRTKIMC
jgi:hypothetical protein